jgi:2,4-dienoyl-CoA reductase-like NADH-dependent reductase (Old Yellow Enzyme family)
VNTALPDSRGLSALLATPFRLRGVEIRNRIMISPMCQYSAVDGLANDWHLVHLGQYALGGAGLVFVEATAIEARGRISPFDLGLWNDAQVAPLARIARFLTEHGATPAIQLAHAGYKASSSPPWEGGGALLGADSWQTVAPSGGGIDESWPSARILEASEFEALADAWAEAAGRACAAGFRIIEIHGAHGYLLHEFLSPITNRRGDRYGGSLESRMRLPLLVVRRVRRALPDDIPLFFRFSIADGTGSHWRMEDSIAFAQALKQEGVDLIDCSSGGIDGPTPTRTTRGLGFQVPYAERVREAAGIATVAVGLIVEPEQAEAILAAGQADIIAIGREALANPQWPAAALAKLGLGYRDTPLPYRMWLERRRELHATLISAPSPEGHAQ